MTNGMIYGFIISLPLVCPISSTVVSSAVNSVPYFSLIFVIKLLFCSSYIEVVVIETESSKTSTFCIMTF